MTTTPKPRLESIAGRLPKRVVIVGNNESAWMAAAYLSRHFAKLDCRVTVVASGQPQGEFPAEASLPSLRGLLSNLQIDEHEMMQQTQGTYHLATQFSDWVQTERDFWKPLAATAHRSAGMSLFDAWFAERSAGRLLRPFHSYSLNWGASLAGKSPYGFSGPSLISQSGAYAFHLDGNDFAAWLRKISLTAGVEEITSDVASVASNGRGGVAQLRLTTGSAVAGDFFIDCTGSEAKLMRAVAADAYESRNDRLLCDRKITVRLPGRRQIPPFSRITGLEAGWSWQFHLAKSIDVGYNFASQFVTDDVAWQQLRESLLMDGIPAVDDITPMFSASPCGRQTKFWRDNVLTLGTAACQLDALVCAGRYMSLLGIEMFMELFPEQSVNKASVDYYNERMGLAVDEISDFAQLHYSLSKRTDSPFWLAATNVPASANITQRLALYDASGTVGPLAPEAFAESEYQHLLAGCGRLPAKPTVNSRSADPAMIQQGLRSLLKSNEAALKDLPLHEELLDWIHTAQNGQQKSA